jgi:hypothetical protein
MTVKKMMLTVIWCLAILICEAQDKEFLSLGSSVVEKDSAGNFMEAKTFRVHEVRIKLNADQNTIEFFTKGFLDRDPFRLTNEIVIRDKIHSPNMDGRPRTEFSGIDKRGRKCIIKFILLRDAYKMRDGELRIEYADHAEIYSIKFRNNQPTFNGS